MPTLKEPFLPRRYNMGFYHLVRMEEALKSPKIQMPKGLSRAEKKAFISSWSK